MFDQGSRPQIQGRHIEAHPRRRRFRSQGQDVGRGEESSKQLKCHERAFQHVTAVTQRYDMLSLGNEIMLTIPKLAFHSTIACTH